MNNISLLKTVIFKLNNLFLIIAGEWKEILNYSLKNSADLTFLFFNPTFILSK